MGRKRKIHKPLKHTFNEVLEAIANNPFDEKKKKFKEKIKKRPAKAERRDSG